MSVVSAQFTLLNRFANAPVNGPGYLPKPYYVGNVGLDGQVVVDGGFLANDGKANAYAADGSFLRALVSGVSSTPSNLIAPWYSAVGVDGKYYVSDAGRGQIVVMGADGVGIRLLGSNAGPGHLNTASGVAVTNLGSLYVADFDHVNVYSTIFNGTNYPLLGTFGSSGTGPGQFSAGIGAVALNPSNSQVYVADVGNNRVQVFSTDGNYLSKIGDASGPGQLNLPSGVGVAGNNRVYVADSSGGLKIFDSSGTYSSTVATMVNGQAFQASTVSASVTGMVYAAGTLGAADFTVMRFFDPAGWTMNTNYFNNAATGPTSVAVGAGQIMGTSLTLGATMGLVVGHTTTVNNGGTLTLAGGSLQTQVLAVDGSASSATFRMTAGTIAANTVTVTHGGVAEFVGQPLTVTLGGGVIVSDATSQFTVRQGATFSATSLSNSGQVTVGPGAEFTVLNTVVNSGIVNLNGGQFDVHGLLANAPGAFVQGTGTVSTTAGLSNGGTVNFSGPSSVLGTVNNLAIGSMGISGAQPTIFFDNVINDGAFTIAAGSAATFQGILAGSKGAAGAGTVFVNGALSPTGLVNMAFGGNVTLGNASHTNLNLGGTLPGVNYDQIQVGGQLNFDGTLQVALAGFSPQVGAIFHLFSWGSKIGSFESLNLPALPAGRSWDASLLYTQGNLRVSITGDLNGDGVVNSQDVAIVGGHWLAAGTGLAGDANNDKVVNSQDIAIVASNWLRTAGAGQAAAVPEPSTLALAALGILGVFARRRVRLPIAD